VIFGGAVNHAGPHVVYSGAATAAYIERNCCLAKAHHRTVSRSLVLVPARSSVGRNPIHRRPHPGPAAPKIDGSVASVSHCCLSDLAARLTRQRHGRQQPPQALPHETPSRCGWRNILISLKIPPATDRRPCRIGYGRPQGPAAPRAWPVRWRRIYLQTRRLDTKQYGSSFPPRLSTPCRRTVFPFFFLQPTDILCKRQCTLYPCSTSSD